MEVFHVRRCKTNGKRMELHLGNPITIVGNVIQVLSDRKLEMMTLDKVKITVNMIEPFSEMIEGWVEVRGKAESINTVRGEDIIVIPKHMVQRFGTIVNNKVIDLLNLYPNPFIDD